MSDVPEARKKPATSGLGPTARRQKRPLVDPTQPDSAAFRMVSSGEITRFTDGSRTEEER
jgi:hypothetical protein